MKCPKCNTRLIRDGVMDVALLTRRLVVNKATRQIHAVCPSCRTPVPLSAELTKALRSLLIVEVKAAT